MIFLYFLYIVDNKKEIHNDIKLNSIPRNYERIEEAFISLIPNEFLVMTYKTFEYFVITLINLLKIFII